MFLIGLQRVYIRWTLSIEYVILNKGPFYVHGCGLVGPCLIGLQRVDIRWILSIKYVVLYEGPSYVQYIRWALIKSYIIYTKGPSYVNSLQANQPGTEQATPMYIRWTLVKVPLFL